MSTFLEVSGVLFWLSVGAGGLWVGLCLWADRRISRGRIVAEYVRQARESKAAWLDEWSSNAHGMQQMAPQALWVLDQQIESPEYWLALPENPAMAKMLARIDAVWQRRRQEAEARDV